MKIKVSKWGNSQGIRIPKSIFNELSINEGDELELNIVNDSIVINKIIPKNKTIIDLFEGYEFDNNDLVKEINWGEAVGEEIWWILNKEAL